MVRAVCPGSFDPVTLGHLDVFARAAKMFDEVIVAVAHNSAKTPLFTAAQRVEFIRQALPETLASHGKPGSYGKIRVEATTGLLVEFCRQEGASVIVKGLRSAVDLDAEYSMALMNRELSGIETVFVLGDPRKAHIASSLVKDVARHGGNVDGFVPENVARALKEKYA
ncbi:Phosphopantetheine adenylyltransferase [Actinobaculum suis]|uniref:Phosphopantetheine adenylyltransferase n=1 Tax=Actinobaculum suis TaxID=1657 RepID=A0A0K9ETM4_9ACTO|nr:pantetheine-phosphate adenylyltransferase [Actinobaculum suis]KMY23549.1 phosphopantetheine adenylyltransferase [Actinobaculum suis]MDY5153276.1 pantetheine-phosphate adenylyltransferase [Actinobaculum suis]OCA96058.1 pantetheine-phosphate adenylyltransferase [Actinobaculum suis]OCA96178.1 pantetheine-phosphate adenylyltransferase [Actinobaculum suis]SDE57485.1 Phosphopantetheine adenylyltransferase [Actinobaculum suis]